MPYSKRFAAGVQTGSEQLLYTVPAGYVAVIRDVEVYSSSGATGSSTIYASIPGPLAAVIISFAPLEGGGTTQWTGRAVLNAGDELLVNVGDGTWEFYISGYLLSSP